MICIYYDHKYTPADAHLLFPVPFCLWKNAVTNILEHLSLDTEAFIFIRQNCKNGASGLQSMCIFNFNRCLAFQRHFIFPPVIGELFPHPCPL